ncbi:hypothetical protein SAMN05660420_01992 [Desulfuromusa kysingii]|uniref:Uncharacterized protein n=1 Tax=Desulfuromusa kysingii TaxID=37625 RepID=A0A1H4AUX5_9BACT|nr:hypothetical protein [Desulfuromusa kysingii]SEA39729.1 hypothetical protein SAMN05660420_01992 [Desulfuromusa kysingii]
MAISGNPKKMAQDVADGFYSLSPPVLKKYTPADLKIILSNLTLVQRDIRQIQIPLENVLLLKAKNMRISRINQALMVLRSYCKKMRIPL